MKPPTDRQFEILEFMRSYQREHHMPPTLREICDAFHWRSTNAAACHLDAMERRGLVTRRPRCARGWLALQPFATGEV